jgi:hypothetical protein
VRVETSWVSFRFEDWAFWRADLSFWSSSEVVWILVVSRDSVDRDWS